MENELRKQILAKHAPDEHHIDCNPILKTAEEIFTLAMAEVWLLGVKRVNREGTEEELQQDGDSELANYSDVINRISIEIANYGDVDMHQKTMSLLTILSKYTFEAKLTLSVAALALNYGQCLILTKVYLSDKIPQHMAILKGIADIIQHSDKIKSWFNNLNNRIISPMLDSAKMTVKLAEIIPICPSIDEKALSVAKDTIILATYWAIKGIVTCAAKVNSMDFELITSVAEQWEISSLAHKIENVKQLMQSQLDLFQKHIDTEKLKNSVEYVILQPLLEMPETDNQQVPGAMKEYELPKTSVLPEALRGKTVLMLISRLNIAEDDDFAILRDLYEQSRKPEMPAENQYEVVWVPIPGSLNEWTHDMRTMFESNRSIMPWTVVDTNKTDPSVLKSIIHRFHYQGQPIVVVIDPSRKVVNNNAIDMIWIWANLGFPFSKDRKEALWKEEILVLELIMNGFDSQVHNWVKEGKYIVIYGADDVKWISEFITTTKQARQLRNIPIETIFVGKNKLNIRETKRSINWIKDKGKGHYLPNIETMWLFWNRIEHIKRSRIRFRSSNNGEDEIVDGITKMLSYEKWGSLFKGRKLIAMGDGNSMLKAMNKYCENLDENENMSFDEAFREYFVEIIVPLSELILPDTHNYDNIRFICQECNRIMEKYVMFKCSHGLE